MVNEKLRKALQTFYLDTDEDEQALILDNHAYDNSIIGLTDDNRLIYDYNKMIEEFAADEDCSLEEAQEWVDYNTMRALPYGGPHAPIVVTLSTEEILERYGD